jgi:dihydrofolate reductase
VIARGASSTMPGPSRIEGYAIVSEDGMLADAQGRIPDALKVKADQEFFRSGLDRAAAVVHGRHSHEGPPDDTRRYRLIATRTIATIARDPARPRALHWNPQGASLEEAWVALDPPAGTLAVIGGTDVYALFLTRGYDAFHLSRVPDVRLPGGRPVFPNIGPIRSPEDVLSEHGLGPGPKRVLDAARGVTLVSWEAVTK